MTSKEWRKHRCYEFDPFAKTIQPALLNSADIKKYVGEGCLVKDFDPCRLKPASYEMKFLGKLYDWEETKEADDRMLKLRCRDICVDRDITLYRNSIAYLWMKEELFLPDYIAARFNLHISYIHKGILLGTGPMIDPGFSGNLLIPLHNLTNNDYVLKGGDGIIWIEFTKVSKNNFWNNQGGCRPADLVLFPDKKDIATAEEYLRKSDVSIKGGVQSAFKKDLDNAVKNSRNAHKESKRIRNIGWLALAIGVIALVIPMFGMVLSVGDLTYNTANWMQGFQNQIFQTEMKEQDGKIKKLEEELDEMKTHLIELSETMKKLEK